MNINRKGFTLVEIMIVVAIIGILAAIAIPNFLKSRQESQKNACIANMKQLEGAFEQAKLAGNTAPTIATMCGATSYIKVEPRCPYKTSSGYTLPATDADRVTCPNQNNGVTDHVLP